MKYKACFKNNKEYRPKNVLISKFTLVHKCDWRTTTPLPPLLPALVLSGKQQNTTVAKEDHQKFKPHQAIRLAVRNLTKFANLAHTGRLSVLVQNRTFQRWLQVTTTNISFFLIQIVLYENSKTTGTITLQKKKSKHSNTCTT